MKTETRVTTIPFDGFYESWHSVSIDDAIERSNEYAIENEREVIDIDVIDFPKVYQAYAESYTKLVNNTLAEWFNIDLQIEFESLDSPREYNFTTDRIFAQIPLSKLEALYNLVIKYHENEIKSYVKSTFSSRSGFISSYSYNLDDWPAIEDWDHNQIGTLLEVAFHLYMSDNDISDMHEFMEPEWGKGFVEECIDAGVTV